MRRDLFWPTVAVVFAMFAAGQAASGAGWQAAFAAVSLFALYRARPKQP